MDLQLAGKLALVTGGSGAIGSAICRALVLEGASVVVTFFRNESAARRTVEAIRDSGGIAVAEYVDVRDEQQVDQLFRRMSTTVGRPDILINCAGVAGFSPLREYSTAIWDSVLDTNLKGAFLCCRAAAPQMAERGGGDIVNISSLAASTGSYEGGAYAASKAGMNALTLSLALELASSNIRVNGVAPGRIATPFRRTHSGPYYDFMLQQTPLKRMGTPQEVANAVAFLASRCSEFITGETLYVTGGLHSVYLQHVVADDSGLLGARRLRE